MLEQGSIKERERIGILNTLCGLCYRHQDVPESAKIVDCYDECIGGIAYLGITMTVFKATYQGRLAAVHVLRPYVGSPESMLRVSSIIVLDPTDDVFPTCDSEIL